MFVWGGGEHRSGIFGRERETPDMVSRKADSFKTNAGKDLVSHPLGAFLGP